MNSTSGANILEELDSRSLALSHSLLSQLNVQNLNSAVESKVSKAIIRFVDKFIFDLIVICGYSMKLEPSEGDAQYCILHLWRHSHLEPNALLEAEIQESLKDSDEEMDSDDDQSYVPEVSDTESESESNADDDSDNDESEADDNSEIDSDETMSELNLDLSFESEQISEESVEESDFVSLLLLYWKQVVHEKFRTEFVVRRFVAELFSSFILKQLQLSFNNSSESLFIRGGYPAFGLLNMVYSQQEELRSISLCFQKQSQLVTNLQQLREEITTTSTISKDISSIVRNLNFEGSEGKNSVTSQNNEEDTENVNPSKQTEGRSSLPFFTPNRLTESTKAGSDDARETDADIENLKTALKTEKQANLYLRLRHEELKLVMGRLNDLVYGRMMTERAALLTTHSESMASSRDAERVNLSQLDINPVARMNTRQESDVVVEDDEDTEDEYEGKPPLHTTFSPPAQLLKKSLKRSHQDLYATEDPNDDTDERHLQSPPLQYDFNQNTGRMSSDLQEQQQQQQHLQQDRPVKKARRLVSLYARQQGPHTPTLFDR